MIGLTHKYVLTGGPGVGKTSVLNVLADRGYVTIPEAARSIIEIAQKEGSDCLPWKNKQKFQDLVTATQMALEDGAVADNIFCDRGIIDGYAYSRLDGLIIPAEIERLGRKRYDTVFLLAPLDCYRTDSARKEDAGSARIIHEAILTAYLRFGYDPVYVSATYSPVQRADFILETIQKSQCLQGLKEAEKK